ncbi:zf-HC2 domain-containing protein [Nonomuraea dietziae]|uniref:anti-sigma factor family protein n=1 Tax=Nonomuraea dietziae TaxID=65515 RepID=UPI0031D29945
MMTCEEVRLSLGAYTLGALDAEEAQEVEIHLASCEGCTDELMELEGLPVFLSKVSEKDVELVASPPREVLDRLLNDRVKRHRRGRLLLVAAASVAALAVGGTVLTTLQDRTQPTSARRPRRRTPLPRRCDLPKVSWQRRSRSRRIRRRGRTGAAPRRRTSQTRQWPRPRLHPCPRFRPSSRWASRGGPSPESRRTSRRP